ADHVGRDRQLEKILEPGQGADARPDRREVAEIGGGEHADDAWQSGCTTDIDAADAAGRLPGAEGGGVEHPVAGDVVDVAALAPQQPRIFAADDRLTDQRVRREFRHAVAATPDLSVLAARLEAERHLAVHGADAVPVQRYMPADRIGVAPRALDR